jgi:hypothetical protein
VGGGGPRHVQNAKICRVFLWSGFRSSDRRQYSGSVLGDVGVTSLKIITESQLSRRRGGGGWVIYTTVAGLPSSAVFNRNDFSGPTTHSW